MALDQGRLQQVMMDTAVNMSVKVTAQMLGISEEAVTKILQVGLPMMAKMANENPEMLKAFFTQATKTLPEPMQQFYSKLAENPEAQQQMVDEFKTMVGPMMESLSRETAEQAGTTANEAGATLATTYPAVSQALTKDAPEQTESGFAQRLRNLTG
jgi:hypothetical protein